MRSSSLSPRSMPSGSVANLILPGDEDCVALMRRGGVDILWRGHRINKFNEVAMPQIRDESLALPNLYLHFLSEDFHVKSNECDPLLRAGNDSSEIRIVLPRAMVPNIPHDSDLRHHLDIVLEFLNSEAELMPSPLEKKGGGFSPKPNYRTGVDPDRLHFSLKTARPKADINLDRGSFGIPAAADMYMFVEHHITVPFMSIEERESFEECIAEMSGNSDDKTQKFGIFLKLFYEGGFGYNKRSKVGDGYLPTNVAIACMQTTEAFPGQAAISTGYPYQLSANFLSFPDTVPVTISGISAMSEKHSRYGFCFTRCVFIWETEGTIANRTLNFCSLLPHGGFYYVPESLEKHSELGGFLYAFGEARVTRSGSTDLTQNSVSCMHSETMGVAPNTTLHI